MAARPLLTSQNPRSVSGQMGTSWVAFVDNYCKSHPLKTVVGAGVVLIKELERRAAR
jgi:hypothetical protein